MLASARNNVRVSGNASARPMLFAHGFGCDQSMWRLVAPEFESTHRVVLFDLVGAGGSVDEAYDTDKYSTLTGHARDVVEICDELELQDVVFVGHSVSAMIGAVAVGLRPELFHSVVMIGPSPRYIDDDESGYRGGFSDVDIDEMLESLDSNYLGWSATMAPAIMGNADRPELGDELTSSFCRADPDIAKHFARTTFMSDNRDDLAAVRVPTLVVQSRDDVIASERVGEYVRDHLPDATYRVLDASGHCPHLSAPAATVEAISAFVGV